MAEETADFDKLLDDFIASQLQDAEDILAEDDDKQSSQKTASEPNTATDTPSYTEENNIIAQSQLDQEPLLASEEKQLFRAYCNFINATASCCTEANYPIPEFSFNITDILPRFRPSRTQRLSADIVQAWESLLLAQPTRLSSLPTNPSDEQILAFAEKTTNNNLQNALISYVEVLIETDSCEIAYNLRKAKYQKHMIEKKIYEEHQNRIERMRKYINAIRQQNFPIDAEMLVNNFFKALRKDPDGAKKVVENNPATFAPIQVDKIPSRFFGLIKAKPEDGFKVNKKLGKFIKDLKI